MVDERQGTPTDGTAGSLMKAEVAADPSSKPPRERGRLLKVVGGLTSVNGAVFLAAMVTGPLQAHGLGPVGRGQLAEILVPVSLGSVVAEFGLGTYAMREAARGRPSGVLLGTMGAMLLAIGVVLALLAVPIATLLVGHRHTVHNLLVLGIILLPIGLVTNLAGGICAGLERWHAYSVSRLIPPVGTGLLIAFVMLTGHLTVKTVALASFALGGAALVPLLVALRGGGSVRFDKAVAREGLAFGSRGWLGTLLGTASAQTGQLIMVALAGPAQLGLYAVASNVAGSADLLSSSVFGAAFPRIASGEHELAARVTRMTIVSVGIVSALAGITAPLLVPAVFGHRFQPAVPIVEILLFVTVLTACATVLGALLTGAGRPGLLAVGDVIALGLAVPGLLVLLPLFGGVGAALAGLLASIVVVVYLLICSSKVANVPIRQFVLITRSDIRWLAGQCKALVPPRFTQAVRRRRLAHELADSSVNY